MPEISVIVPVYNVEKYLHRCINSILDQTFTDFELILVDDGSPDNCGKICDKYAEKDNRIKVIHKQNGGLSSARNAGLDIATGKYVMFCDSDDYVHYDWCKTMYDEISINQGQYIVTDIYRVFNNNIMPINDNRKLDNAYKYQLSYFELYKSGLSGFTVNKIYDLQLLNKYNIRFDENCFFAEDVAFNVAYMRHIDSILFIQKHLYYYIDNPVGIMRSYRPTLFFDNIKLFSIRLELINSSEINEYCNIWLYQFLNLFNNIFDKQNTKMSLFQKFQYNNKMIKTKEFQYCVENSTENNITKTFLKSKNYYIYWLYQKLITLKQKLRSK